MQHPNLDRDRLLLAEVVTIVAQLREILAELRAEEQWRTKSRAEVAAAIRLLDEDTPARPHLTLVRPS